MGKIVLSDKVVKVILKFALFFMIFIPHRLKQGIVKNEIGFFLIAVLIHIIVEVFYDLLKRYKKNKKAISQYKER